MPEKILVRAPNWLGDAVMCTPFLKRLKEKNPAAAVHVLCKASFTDLFEGHPAVDKVLPFAPGSSPFSLAAQVRGEGYGRTFVLPPSFSSAFSAWWARIPRRTGYAADFRGPLLTERFPLDERFHYVRRYLGLLGEAGRDVEQEDFYFPTAPEGDIEALLKTLGLGGGRSFLAVAPGGRAPARRWFPERFAEVIDQWTGDGVVLLGAPEDAPFAAEVAKKTRRPAADLCGKTTLPVLGGFLKKAAALVANESGLMHAGWAMGAPMVIIAGPSDPYVTSPFGARVKVLQHREVPCVPCVKNECPRTGAGYKECLKRIDAAEVSAALAALPSPLARTPAAR